VLFRYEARKPDGGSETGEIEAKSRGHALVLLRERGLLVDALGEAGRPQAARQETSGGQGILYPLWPIRASSLAFFFDQLGRLLSAGVTPHEAFASMQERVGGRLRRVCREGATASAGGGAISAHLARYPRYFAPHVIAMMRAGELSGALPEVCQELRGEFEGEASVARWMSVIKVYLALNLLPCVFVPSFPGMLKHINQKGATPMDVLRPGLQWYGQHVVHYVLPWLVLLAAVWLVAKVVLNLPGLTGVRDWLSLYVPVVSAGSRRAIVARFMRTLELLQRAAVPPAQALHEAALATGNRLVAARVAAPAARLREGGSMAEALRASGVFSPAQVGLLATAEQTGTMEDALSQLSARTREEREGFAKIATRGGCVAGIVISAVCVLFAAAAGYLAFYQTLFKIFESPDWQP
jgi:type II secretory pathway component PulF